MIETKYRCYYIFRERYSIRDILWVVAKGNETLHYNFSDKIESKHRKLSLSLLSFPKKNLIITPRIVFTSDSLPTEVKINGGGGKKKTSPINGEYTGTVPKSRKKKKKIIQRGIQIDHRGGKRIEKGKRRGAAINIGSGWFRRVERRPSKRQSPLLLSSFAMPSLRTGLVVTRVQPSANKEGRGGER